MSFLNPLFLIALLTVGVPLLIYLLNLRKPKKVRFSTLAFFESLKSTALKRIKIKRWLLLAIRMLAIIALVVAASRPFMPSGMGIGGNNDPIIVGVLIDNSPAMVQVDRNGPFIEQALNLAGQTIESFDTDNRFLINVTHGEGLNMPALSRSAALNRLSGLQSENKGGYFKERLMQLRNELAEAEEPNKILFLITGGQQSHFDELREDNDDEESEINIQVVKVGSSMAQNTGFRSVDVQSASIEQSGQVQLRTVVENFGEQTARNQFVSLIVDDELISQQPIEVEAGSHKELLFTLPASDELFTKTEILIEGDELVFDNRFYAAIQLPDVTNVLVVEENTSARSFNSYLRPLLEAVGSENDQYSIRFISIGDLSPTEIYSQDAIIMDGVRDIPDYISQPLLDHVQSGAGLFLLPSPEGNLTSYNRLLSSAGSRVYTDVIGNYGSFSSITQMAAPASGHPIIDLIFDEENPESIRLNAPDMFYYFRMSSAIADNVFPVITTTEGNVLMREARVGTGRIIFSAFGADPGWSNFPIKPFFAPFFFRTVEYLAQGEDSRLNVHYLGSDFQIVSTQNSESFEIIKDNESIVPTIRQSFQGSVISYPGEEWSPGWITVKSDFESILFSVNQYAMESSLITLDEKELKNLISPYFGNVTVSNLNEENSALSIAGTASMGREIWFWFIIAAIILLLIESIISRSYKAESLT